MITAIIQARLGSTRLKNKMLLDLHGYKIIEWVLKRVKHSSKIEQIVLAIPDTKENDLLEEIGYHYGYKVFRGSENDVLSRFYHAAKKYNASIIIRVCADNPLICASEIDNLVEYFLSGNYDYAYNHIPKNNYYPDGLGAEIVSYNTLLMIFNNAKLPKHREHVFNFIWDNIKEFKIGTFSPLDKEIHHPELKLDLDTKDDYQWLKKLDINPIMNTKQIVHAALEIPRG